MALPRETREKAYAMYCAGIVPNKITSYLGLKKDSIYRWIKTYNWEEKRHKIWEVREKEKEKSEQDLKIVESILAMYTKAISENQSEMIKKINYHDVIEAVKLKRLLQGETTENIQMNSEVMSVKEEVNKILKGKIKEEDDE